MCYIAAKIEVGEIAPIVVSIKKLHGNFLMHCGSNQGSKGRNQGHGSSWDKDWKQKGLPDQSGPAKGTGKGIYEGDSGVKGHTDVSGDLFITYLCFPKGFFSTQVFSGKKKTLM